jgi:taurine dioxygenase
MSAATVTWVHPSEGFAAEQLCGALGAEIRGIDLSRPLDDAARGFIRDAFARHLVLVFRGQTLSAQQQIDFTRLFGPVERHPLYRSAVIDTHPEILVLEHRRGEWVNGRNDIWHADMTFTGTPPLGTVLYCRDIEEGRGDTMFCNMHLAFDSLSPGMQRLLTPLFAEHSAELLVRRNNARPENVPIPQTPPPVSHPVVATHPETGRKSLYVNPVFTRRFCGMTDAESRPLLDMLYAAALRPEHIYRHRWRVDDVVIWDNRVTMHYAVIDYGPDMHRLMLRTTATGGAIV